MRKPKLSFSNNSKVPAIVLGSSITTLGVLRSLGQLQIPSIYVSNNNSYITRSRYCTTKLITSANLSDSKSLSKILESLPVERGVLFPCSDSLLLAVASLGPEIKARFPSSHAKIDAIEKLLDKAGLAEILSTYKLPHPKTIVIENKNDITKLKEHEFEGVFIKPRESHKFFKRYAVKAFQCDNRADTIAKAVEIQEAGFALVLQDYIPGPKSNHYFIDGFVDRFGKIQTLFARRRMRMFPPDFGNSSYMYSVPLSNVTGAVKTLERLFSSIEYRGIFSTEFKFDERDGLYKVIEVNVRPWWYIEFATSCGINVCQLAYQDALEQDVSPLNGYKIGTSLVYLYYDILSYQQLNRENKISTLPWLKSLWWARHPIFCWNDPMPALAKSNRWFIDFVKRRVFH